MIGRTGKILINLLSRKDSPYYRFLSLSFILLVILNSRPLAQVITNEGAAISLTPGIVVSSKDAINNAGGTLTNNGTFDLKGNYTSNANTGGDGLYRIGGNWSTTGGLFSHGSSTVFLNGIANQLITIQAIESFNNLVLNNLGTAPFNRVGLGSNVEVSGILSMTTGNIDASTFRLYLSNPAISSLNYNSLTRSRIFGKFERRMNEIGAYLFPLGTSDHYNPANLIPNNITATGSVLSEFITVTPPGNTGLPIPDPPVEIAYAYPSGYWSMTSNGFTSNDYHINLDAAGFTDTIFDVTRVIKRISGGSWTVDGTHADAVDSVVFRNNLTGGISNAGSEFALGRARPLIVMHPRDTIVCENDNPTFTVIATGAELLTYRWYKAPDIQLVNGDDYSGARTSTLTIIDVQLSDAGQYYCIVTDRYGMKTQSNNATLTVNKRPVATVSEPAQDHECSGIDFEDIILGESYGVPGTTYIWTRTNPSGITSSVPLSGSGLNIGDILSGSFINTTDAPIIITFTILPSGPAPTYCLGKPATATVTVNPTPRVIPQITKPVICNNQSTLITLNTPTVMTRGIITFDYTIGFTGNPGDITGYSGFENDKPIGHQVIYTYQNTSDTVNSVNFSIRPHNDISGCFAGDIVIAETKVHPRPLQNVVISKTLTCEGGSDATLTATLSRGSKPDMVRWIGPFGHDKTYTTTSNTNSDENLIAGFYTVTVTDNFGCVNTLNAPAISGADLDPYLYVKEKDTGFGTTCPESADGEIWIKETYNSSGIAPFEYWLVYNDVTLVSHGILPTTETWQYFYNLPSGKYKLVTQDANGCRDSTEAMIYHPDPIDVTFDKHIYAGGFNVTCKGYTDGSAWVSTVTGGNGGYRYKWYTINGTITGVDTLNRLENISAGTYYLLITDAKNCTAIDSVTLNEPDGMVLASNELSLSPDGNYNISCSGGNNGSVKLTISGGSGTYTYLWSGPGAYSATTKDISGLVAGTYSATVRDVNGCILMPMPSFTLTQPDPLIIGSTSSVSTEGSHNINCNGGTGSIDITVTGGSTGNYSYSWSTTNGSGLVQGLADQSGLSAGTYHLVVTDLNNCEAERNITITQPDQLTLTLVPTHITCQSAGFSDGSIDLTVAGGVAPYTYSWSNGSVSQDISGLTEGLYNVTVTDFNGCVTTGSVRIDLPPPIQYTKVISNYNGYNIGCFGQSNGSIDITVTSGTAPYIFLWQKEGSTFTATTEDLTNITAGRYQLHITDKYLCTATETIEITQPGRLSMIINASVSVAGGFNINCAGDSTGSIDITPVNNVGSISYLWSDGETEKTRLSVPAGYYGIIITDINGCQADSSIILTEPDTIKLEFDYKMPWCPDKPDGEIRLNATGGVAGAGYSYIWSDNSTNPVISNIRSGWYSVTVTDLNGCVVKDSLNLRPQNETCLIIPNIISPNDDLINDLWNIGEKELYPQLEIKIFNRWGEVVWRSEKGYPHPWDGKGNGSVLPVDSYHYIIDLHNGSKPLVGNVTIVR